jgi:hypothetical protein
LNGEEIASPVSKPSKPNATQRAFSVIEISPTLCFESDLLKA